MKEAHLNHLAKESSPYLQQHAENPVDWYPWGEAAFKKARAENKPILLSIGYAACHWCHVMAHESFADQETANLMNTFFVNIKVDREERPDLDKIYQTAHYLLTQKSGGWPLTIFLTPDDLVPFFSGTYFPREQRYQLPAFKEILMAIAELYQQQFPEIQQQNAELLKLLQRDHPVTATPLDETPIQKAMQELEKSYDSVNGGFGQSPKFPQTPKFEFLLQINSPMTFSSLKHMAMGGIFDQLAGGFFRYTVDASWHIPHFEKMLYDNGQLLFLYAKTAQKQKDVLFANTARATADWVLEIMQAKNGYFASLDADSEGKEGKYYLWDKSAVKELLTEKEYAVVELYFGFDKPPNFDKEWCIYISRPLDLIATHLKISMEEAHNHLASAKLKLKSARDKRTAPNIDTKILTSWNSLMIKGLLTAGQVLNEPRFIQSAKDTIDFIQKNLWQEKQLFANYMNGKAQQYGFLDDYAFLIDALLSALQIEWNTKYLLFAIELTEVMIDKFYDNKNGGFFFTAKDQEKILYRPKTMMDEAVPSGNGIAVRALLLLSYLLGETRYLDIAEKTLQMAWPYLSSFPAEHCTLLMALNDFLHPKKIIIIRGQGDELIQWQKESNSVENIVFAIPNKAELPSYLASKKATNKACAYICTGTVCSAVIEHIEELRKSASNLS